MADIDSIAFQSGDNIRFQGAKVTVFVGSKIVTILRDDIPSIPLPDHWDFPGGGRENAESPWACAARECFEEVSLTLAKTDILWARPYKTGDVDNWFFVAKVPAHRAADLQLGEEGQRFKLMTVDEYLHHPKAVPHFQKRLADWVAGL